VHRRRSQDGMNTFLPSSWRHLPKTRVPLTVCQRLRALGTRSKGKMGGAVVGIYNASFVALCWLAPLKLSVGHWIWSSLTIAEESLRFGHHLLEFEVHPCAVRGLRLRRPPPRAVGATPSDFHFMSCDKAIQFQRKDHGGNLLN
jgi:hypothetical protein